MPRPVGVPVILVDGPSAGLVIHTAPDVRCWNVHKPVSIQWPLALDCNVTIPAPTVYQICEIGLNLPNDRGGCTYIRRRIGWSEGSEAADAAIERHVRAALLERPDLMPPGCRPWPTNPAYDEPIRILASGDGPQPSCTDEIQMNPAAMEIRGICGCGWITEFVPRRRFEELGALTGAHVDAAVQQYVREGVCTVEAYRELMGITDQANRRGEFDGIIETLEGAHYAPARRAIAPPADEDAAIARLDWGQPLTAADANWPADASRVCAHVCGGGHDCDVRATTSLTYELPSGGTRTMPMCAACKAAELAEAPRV